MGLQALYQPRLLPSSGECSSAPSSEVLDNPQVTTVSHIFLKAAGFALLFLINVFGGSYESAFYKRLWKAFLCSADGLGASPLPAQWPLLAFHRKAPHSLELRCHGSACFPLIQSPCLLALLVCFVLTNPGVFLLLCVRCTSHKIRISL